MRSQILITLGVLALISTTAYLLTAANYEEKNLRAKDCVEYKLSPDNIDTILINNCSTPQIINVVYYISPGKNMSEGTRCLKQGEEAILIGGEYQIVELVHEKCNPIN
ncbi:transmembrane protein, putative (macronuclear) [Tetrahymena thermophila SB210]|uniref:Transmembrane protein, putative n=1 Tax=Tetrahymena thermophila (strain SB210) TaxID=312017 RepID=Q22S25_TETTS|nr:transmembrane protein, putative [Tetrahymena thermophila SB210]EAR87947.1 transmembrane protein, putative [Tetrahymena thermophila SB210]|eukprot:XP_001008192.1 transmembrane protein, putative [Tetrahymena thermophila SB210]